MCGNCIFLVPVKYTLVCHMPGCGHVQFSTSVSYYETHFKSYRMAKAYSMSEL